MNGHPKLVKNVSWKDSSGVEHHNYSGPAWEITEAFGRTLNQPSYNPMLKREVVNFSMTYPRTEPDTAVDGTVLQRRVARRVARRLRHSNTIILAGQRMRTSLKGKVVEYQVKGDFPHPEIHATPLQDKQVIAEIQRVVANRK